MSSALYLSFFPSYLLPIPIFTFHLYPSFYSLFLLSPPGNRVHSVFQHGFLGVKRVRRLPLLRPPLCNFIRLFIYLHMHFSFFYLLITYHFMRYLICLLILFSLLTLLYNNSNHWLTDLLTKFTNRFIYLSTSKQTHVSAERKST